MVLVYFCLISLYFVRGLAGEVPIMGGVLGDVPRGSSITSTAFTARRAELSNVTTPGKLRVVENSGVCETTSGVFQASGYGDITATESIWFWFFESRQNPDTAPLTLWFNGGPGSSSMIGLLQEHGPCRITNDSSSVTLNPFSWNNEANIVYIDQPVGVGFSYGDLKVGTSQEAASDYQKNKLAIWTESYGGHYGPTFAAYFLSQNAAIAAGRASGITLNLKVLGIGNGLTDPLIQYSGYITYARSNPYHALVSPSVIDRANTAWTKSGGCQAQIESCYNGGSNSVCSKAQGFCNQEILSPLAGNWDPYYVPTLNPDPYPPNLTDYLNSIASTVGANVVWQVTNDDVYANFAATGDWMRNSRPDLEAVINAGIRTIVYDGDADYILNFNGVEAMVDNLNTQFTSLYQQQAFRTYTVAGQAAGQFKNAGLFSYIRIYGAGHEVPAYKFGELAVGQAAAQMFTQIMANQSLSST